MRAIDGWHTTGGIGDTNYNAAVGGSIELPAPGCAERSTAAKLLAR